MTLMPFSKSSCVTPNASNAWRLVYVIRMLGVHLIDNLGQEFGQFAVFLLALLQGVLPLAFAGDIMECPDGCRAVPGTWRPRHSQ